MRKHLVIADSVVNFDDNLFSWSTGEKIETFNDFDLLRTKTHLKKLILTDIDTNTII